MPRPVLVPLLLALAACRSSTPAADTPPAPAEAPASDTPAKPDPAAAKATPATDALPDPLPDRDSALAHRLVDDYGAILLDVRTPEEFADQHIDDATNIPHDQIESRLDEIAALTKGDPQVPIVVYCGSGRRAGIAKEALKAHGYGRVTNLGGIDDW